MKFLYHIYVVIIISRNILVVQNAADFTIEELTRISQELNPIECMRLLEGIYFAISNIKNERRISRDTPVNTWSSEKECLNELNTWNQQFSDKIEPQARTVMILHLNSLGRSDLADYVRRNKEKSIPLFNRVLKFDGGNIVQRKNNKIRNNKIFRRDASKKKSKYHPHSKTFSHEVKRSMIHGGNYRYDDRIHRPMITAFSGGVVGNGAPGEKHGGKFSHGISRNSLFLLIALGIVVFFICGIVFLIFRRSLKYSACSGERRDLRPCGNNVTREKGLQCIRCSEDYVDYETQSNAASQITEIDVEGGSCINSCRAFSDTVSSFKGRITPGISIEELQLPEDDAVHEILGESCPLSSCRCRPLDKKICRSSDIKSRKDKRKREDNKCKNNCQKSSAIKKNCTFDMRQFQDKIVTVLNHECGVCQCCNCTPQWELDADSKDNESPARHEETRLNKKQGKKELKKNEPSKRDKNGKLSPLMTKEEDRKVLSYQISARSKSPFSERRSTKKQDSESVKKSKHKTRKKEKSGKKVTKKNQDTRVLLSSSSDTDENEDEDSRGRRNNKDDKKRRRFKSKKSNRLDSSIKTLLSAHDKPIRRFF